VIRLRLGCLFPPTIDTATHIQRAEELGYECALVYDSPAFLADPWVTLALAAARTSWISLGVATITPRLRHVVASAGALATLSALAPGRIEVVVGTGFTSRLMLGKRPAPWVEVEAYAAALRALLNGEEIEWDGALIGLRHGARSGVRLPAAVTIRIAAHGPVGRAVAERVGDGTVTNLSHSAGDPAPPDMSRVRVLYYGTVLAEGERLDSERVLEAAGPYAAFQLHIGEYGLAAHAPERAAFERAVGRIEARRRHLEVHRGHLIGLTDLERPLISAELIAATTGTGTPEEVRRRIEEIAATGAEGVLYGPMGADIPRELAAFAAATMGTPPAPPGRSARMGRADLDQKGTDT
jgi:5,10-methylenetetrahydromethanopterin reductase